MDSVAEDLSCVFPGSDESVRYFVAGDAMDEDLLLAAGDIELVGFLDINQTRAQIDRAYEVQPTERVPLGSLQDWARRYIDGIDGRGEERTHKWTTERFCWWKTTPTTRR